MRSTLTSSFVKFERLVSKPICYVETNKFRHLLHMEIFRQPKMTNELLVSKSGTKIDSVCIMVMQCWEAGDSTKTVRPIFDSCDQMCWHGWHTTSKRSWDKNKFRCDIGLCYMICTYKRADWTVINTHDLTELYYSILI